MDPTKLEKLTLALTKAPIDEVLSHIGRYENLEELTLVASGTSMETFQCALTALLSLKKLKRLCVTLVNAPKSGYSCSPLMQRHPSTIPRDFEISWKTNSTTKTVDSFLGQLFVEMSQDSNAPLWV